MENPHEFIEKFRNIVNGMSSEEYDSLITSAFNDLKIMSSQPALLNIYLPKFRYIENPATAMASITGVCGETYSGQYYHSRMVASSVVDLTVPEGDLEYAIAG